MPLVKDTLIVVLVATAQMGVFKKPVTPEHVMDPTAGRVTLEGNVNKIVFEFVIAVLRVKVKV